MQFVTRGHYQGLVVREVFELKRVKPHNGAYCVLFRLRKILKVISRMRETELGPPLRRCPFVRWRKRCDGISKADLREVGVWNTKCMKLFQVLVQWRVLISGSLGLYICYFRMCFYDGLVISQIVRCSWELILLLLLLLLLLLCYCCCVCFCYCYCYIWRLAMLFSHRHVATRSTRTTRNTVSTWTTCPDRYALTFQRSVNRFLRFLVASLL